MKTGNNYYQNNRCPVCNGSIQETDSVCAVCSFPVISMMHGSTEEIRCVEEQIVAYRKHYYGLRWVAERENPALAAAIGKALLDEQCGKAPFTVVIPPEPYLADQLTLLKDNLEKSFAECGSATSENIVWMRDIAAVIGNYISQSKVADVAREKVRLEARQRHANAQKREARAKWKSGEKSIKAAWVNGTALLRVYQSGQLFEVSEKDENTVYDEKKLWYLQGALLLYSQNADNEPDREWMRDIALFIIKTLEVYQMRRERSERSAEILRRKNLVSWSWHYGKKDVNTAYAIGMALLREYQYGIPFSMKKEDMESACDNQKLQYLQGALLMLSSKQIDAAEAGAREDAEWMQDIALAISDYIA